MGAPLPKPPNQRRRRNKGQSQWEQLPAGGRTGAAPSLPEGEWESSTVDWWAKLWASPMAAAYQDADLDSLVRLARLKDDFAKNPRSSTALPAMQQLEDRFGLSPKARRALQWEIVAAEAATSGSSSKGASVRRLRVVADDAA